MRLRRRPTRSRFEDLLRPHLEFLYRLAWRLTGNTADSEDLVQDLLLKLYPRTQDVAAVEALRPWLARVLYRRYVDFVRHRTRSPVISEPDAEVLEQQPDERDNPEQSFERARLQAALLDALRQLNPEQRAVVVLHDIEGYRLEELEPVLEAPVGTLKSRLHRARSRLRSLLRTEPFRVPERVKD